MLLCRVITGAFALFIAASAHSADLLDTVRSKKEIVVGTEAQFAPFEFVKDGKIVGYGPDLMNLILSQVPDVKVKQYDVPFQGILPGLATKRFDFVITSVTMTKERANKFAFTVPIADATVALITKKGDSQIKTAEDIAGKVVGSQAGSAQLKALQGYIATLKTQGKPEPTVREYVSFDEAYADLAAGRLAAVAQSKANLATLIKARPDVYSIIDTAIGPRTYFGWVGRKDENSASLVKFFSDGIAQAAKSGKMQELQKKWFGFTMEVPTDTVPTPEL